jgi:hypothetical protein
MISISAEPVLIAQTQCTAGYSLAKLVKQGTSTVAVAGSGTVKVQVQVNADGTHKAIKVISSTNPADNDAAMDLAQNSTYKPAMCGSQPQSSFYDFNMKFNGKAATNSASAGSNGPIEGLIRGGKYDEAISKANAALLASPGDQSVLTLLGIAQYYNKQTTDAAATFDKVTSIPKNYQAIAASAFADAAVLAAANDAATSLAYGSKAVALANTPNSQFALGVAEIANKQYPAAISALKIVRAKATDKAVQLAVDRQLLSAYLNTNDDANVKATADDMKSLDPSGNASAVAMASHYIDAGTAAMNAKQFDAALKQFDLAIATGAPQAMVTANTDAAFSELSMTKPDYAKAQAYAEKALAANGNSPEANYAAGIALGNQYATNKKASDREKALSYLNKADQLAKAAGNMGLALQIEQQIKNIPQ